MSLDGVVGHGKAELTDEILNKTLATLPTEAIAFMIKKQIPEPRFIYLGNGQPVSVMCVINDPYVGQFKHTALGTDNNAMAEAYKWVLLNMYAHGIPERSHGV